MRGVGVAGIGLDRDGVEGPVEFGAIDAAEEKGTGGGGEGVEVEAVGVGVDGAGGNHELGDGGVAGLAVVDALLAGAVGEAPEAVLCAS